MKRLFGLLKNGMLMLSVLISIALLMYLFLIIGLPIIALFKPYDTLFDYGILFLSIAVVFLFFFIPFLLLSVNILKWTFSFIGLDYKGNVFANTYHQYLKLLGKYS